MAATLVVPCYNEAKRLDRAAFLAMPDRRPDVRLLFVDDGSTDDTARILAGLAAERPEIEVLSLAQNAGKAEAVRRGMLAAAGGDPDVVGYFDADLSTPVPEVLRLLEVMEARAGVAVVMGARIALLGKHVERSVTRHYLGRVFASFASLVLRTRVYDTQCGAKLFRRSPALLAALDTPFLSRWAFDVELLGRLLVGRPPDVEALPEAAFLEVPLDSWRDVPGSKLRGAAMAGALKDLTLIGIDLAQRRRAGRSGEP